MSPTIKYNEFGEVMSVNGITTGHHLGTPMQDAIGTPEENSSYGTEIATVSRSIYVVEDKQPDSSGEPVVDVPELPEENISPDVVYKVVNKPENTSSVIYGIPNEEGTKTVFEHKGENGWVELNPGGGKDPILAELVVTENGVYDEPVIGGGIERIVWDGVIGDRVTGSFTSTASTQTYVKVSDRVLSIDEMINGTITVTSADGSVEDMDLVTTAEDVIHEDGVAMPSLFTLFVISKPKNGENFFIGTVLFPETGIYIADLNSVAPITNATITFPNAPAAPTPADGWNKVTVNVAGDIVDVPELPTENIEEGKIYRVTEESEPTVYVAVLNDSGEPIVMSYADMLYAGMSGQFSVVTHVYVVDSLPDQFEEANIDTTTMTYTVSLYIVRDTGVVYYAPSPKLITLGEGNGVPSAIYGWVDSVDDIVPSDNLAFYTVRGQSSTTYGIPNTAPVKRLVDGAWVDLA